MKKKIEEFVKKEAVDNAGKKITRKEAIKKTGYMAVSAATMMILLSSPSQAQASHTPSQPAPPPASTKPSGGGIWNNKKT